MRCIRLTVLLLILIVSILFSSVSDAEEILNSKVVIETQKIEFRVEGAENSYRPNRDTVDHGVVTTVGIRENLAIKNLTPGQKYELITIIFSVREESDTGMESEQKWPVALSSELQRFVTEFDADQNGEWNGSPEHDFSYLTDTHYFVKHIVFSKSTDAGTIGDHSQDSMNPPGDDEPDFSGRNTDRHFFKDYETRLFILHKEKSQQNTHDSSAGDERKIEIRTKVMVGKNQADYRKSTLGEILIVQSDADEGQGDIFYIRDQITLKGPGKSTSYNYYPALYIYNREEGLWDHGSRHIDGLPGGFNISLPVYIYENGIPRLNTGRDRFDLDFYRFASGSSSTERYDLNLPVGKVYAVQGSLDAVSQESGEQWNVLNHNTDAEDKDQCFYIKPARFLERTPDIRTIVKIGEKSAGEDSMLIHSSSGDTVMLNIEDSLEVRNLIPDIEYDIEGRIYEVTSLGERGAVPVVVKRKAVRTNVFGDLNTVISFNPTSLKSDQTYTVVQILKSKEKIHFIAAGMQYHEAVHNAEGKIQESQTFKIVKNGASEDIVQGPSDTPDPEEEQEEPTVSTESGSESDIESATKASPSTAVASTDTSATASESSTELQTGTTTGSTVNTIPNSSVTLTSMIESSSQRDVPETSATVSTAATSSEESATPFITTSFTTRTFEFIEISEDIPLGIRTTAPIDFEEILILEEIPLGFSELPYTAFSLRAWYVGLGLLITTLGLTIVKRIPR